MTDLNAKSDVVSAVTGLVAAFQRDEEGSTAIEYSLIAGLIFLAIVASVRAFTGSTNSMYNEISDAVTGSSSP